MFESVRRTRKKPGVLNYITRGFFFNWKVKNDLKKSEQFLCEFERCYIPQTQCSLHIFYIPICIQSIVFFTTACKPCEAVGTNWCHKSNKQMPIINIFLNNDYQRKFPRSSAFTVQKEKRLPDIFSW